MVLHQQDHHPLTSALPGSAQIEVKGPKGETIATSAAGSQDSIIGWTWTVPEQCAGGSYRIVVSYPTLGLPPAEREFEVRAFRAPRLKTDSSSCATATARGTRSTRACASSAASRPAPRSRRWRAWAIEITALAALAWLRADGFAAQAERAMQAIGSACKGGRFGSTQSTVLALRAILAYDQARSRPAAASSPTLLVDGKPFGAPLAFDDKAQGQLALPDAAKALGPGRHTLAVRMDGGTRMPYAISVSYHAAIPASSPRCALDLSVSLPAKTIAEGEPTEATVRIANRTAAEVASPIAIVGLPGGLEPRHEQLKELVKAGRIAAYEVRGRELILYWRGFGPKQEVTIPVSLIAAIPGRYTAPASRLPLLHRRGQALGGSADDRCRAEIT